MTNDVRNDAVTARLSALSRPEKEAIALGRWAQAPTVTEYVYTDGGNGIRDAVGATAFPSTLALAASFDRVLARSYGEALGAETRAAGRNVLLGPVLDVARVPWNGRTGEGLGESPELTAEIGGQIIEGAQSQGVITVLKHMVANNFESGRTGSGPFGAREDSVDVIIDEVTLREVYLKPFERAIVEHGATGVMSSYNRLNSRYPAEDPGLWQLVRGEWGFEGVSLPDFLFAVRDDAAALAAGLDLPGLGDPHGRTPEMVARLSDPDLDRLVSHVLWAAEAVGLAPANAEPALLATPAALGLAEEIVIAGAVLLDNPGILPLAAGTRVALVTPGSIDHLLTIGGSAAVTAPAERTPSLAESLRRQGMIVDEVHTSASDVPLPTASEGDGVIGIAAEIQTGGEVRQLELPAFALHSTDVGAASWSASVRGVLHATRTGAVRITADFAGRLRLSVDGSPVAEGVREASPMIAGPSYPLHYVVDLEEGHDLSVTVDFDTFSAISIPEMGIAPFFSVGVSSLDDADATAATVAAADVAILVLGRASGEAMDVDSLELPEDQVRLLNLVTEHQKSVVLLTLGSGPLALSPRDGVASLHAWQAGERAAEGIARIISGESEPGGRLPLTFPARNSDVPIDADGYPGIGNRASYADGVAVGYLAYEAAGIHPGYPFGHGLGYAGIDLTWCDFGVDATTVWADAELTNPSDRAGSAVVQLYARAPGDAGASLIGFERVQVAANATVHARVTVGHDRLARWRGSWVVASGEYELTLGLSSTDRRHSGTVLIGKGTQ